MEVQGVLAAGESTAALAYLKGRRGLSPRWTKLILLTCMFGVGFPVGVWACGSWFGAAMAVEFTFLGLIVGGIIVQLLAGPLMRKALIKRGQAYEQPLVFRVTIEAIVCEFADLSMVARWPCVTDLFRTRKYWVFLVQSSAMVLPRRFFDTPDRERAFIIDVMSRMTPAARERSPDAAKFIGSQSIISG